ncbi:hypothetical protein LCGC14_1069150 [marine sediment metagenome]|uniref:Uncharacterized protein n=1 Tax=marine sediment metagenome TaxID=412755 RepID=A0A0F9N5V5_9ZZZZ
MTETIDEQAKQAKGAFIVSLKRNNKQIRDDRATAIGEDTELLYKRQMEDLGVNLKRMHREQENMLDLSPHDTHSLILASDFDSADYVSKDIALGVKIRNEEIRLEIAKSRYRHLFAGGE